MENRVLTLPLLPCFICIDAERARLAEDRRKHTLRHGKIYHEPKSGGCPARRGRCHAPVRHGVEEMQGRCTGDAAPHLTTSHHISPHLTTSLSGEHGGHGRRVHGWGLGQELQRASQPLATLACRTVGWLVRGPRASPLGKTSRGGGAAREEGVADKGRPGASGLPLRACGSHAVPGCASGLLVGLFAGMRGVDLPGVSVRLLFGGGGSSCGGRQRGEVEA